LLPHRCLHPMAGSIEITAASTKTSRRMDTFPSWVAGRGPPPRERSRPHAAHPAVVEFGDRYLDPNSSTRPRIRGQIRGPELEHRPRIRGTNSGTDTWTRTQARGPSFVERWARARDLRAAAHAGA